MIAFGKARSIVEEIEALDKLLNAGRGPILISRDEYGKVCIEVQYARAVCGSSLVECLDHGHFKVEAPL